MSALSGTSLTVTTLTTAGLLTNNTSGQVSSVTGSALASLLGGAPSFTGLTLSGLSTGILKVTSGVVSVALAGTDYQAALTAGSNITLMSNTVATNSTPSFTGLTLSGLTTGLLKVTSGIISTAAAGTDYQAALTAGSNITLISNTIATSTTPTFTSMTLGTLSGVLSAVSGAVNNVNLSTSLTFTSGTNTLATVQDITTGAAVQFSALTLSSLGTGLLKVTSGAVGLASAINDYYVGATTNLTYGPSALPSITAGTYNVAIGNTVGSVVTTGPFNVYIGGNIAASATDATGEIVINSTATTTTGRGSNTALIRATSGLFAYNPYYQNYWNNNANVVNQVEQWVATPNTVNFGTAPTITAGVISNLPLGVYRIDVFGSYYGSNQTYYPTLQYRASGGSFVDVCLAFISFGGAWTCPFSITATIRISNAADAIQLYYYTTNYYSSNTGTLPANYSNGYLPRYITLYYISV